MADIFVSYTSKDRDWAEWIGQELERLGHVAHIDAWEISGGGDIAAWMEERHDKADHILCVISETYLSKPYSSWERRSGQWAAQTDRPNFVLPVRIEDCKLRTLLASVRYCDLFGLEENEARARFSDFLKPAVRPTQAMPFPGGKLASTLTSKSEIAFPGKANTASTVVSNITIKVPRHFLGREDDLKAIDIALNGGDGRAAITALHGLRGVGKTVLAAAYAEQRRNRYRATWWIRAETEPTMRADLVGLGVRLDWLPPDAQEEPALAAVLNRLREDGDGILLIYDNANNAREFETFAPRGGSVHVIVTSNAPDWRAVAAPVKIEVWSPATGANFLVERTGQPTERAAALALSEALGGLPLAHEQAAAYCGRLGIRLAMYASRFAAAPAKFLGDERAAPEQYHNGLTVAKTFGLAIEEATKLHPAAETLIAYAALLAPEPIPLFLFSEGREYFSEPLVSLIEGDGIDEAVAALRAFALVDREAIPDERDSTIVTDCIRLHRLVREVSSGTSDVDGQARIRLGLIAAAAAAAYPAKVLRDPDVWPRMRRLDPIATALMESGPIPDGAKIAAAVIFMRLASYREGALGNAAEAELFMKRALVISEAAFGPDHQETASILNALGYVLEKQNDLAAARSYYERALKIREKVLGRDHPETAISISNFGMLLRRQGDLAEALSYTERALAIDEKVLGSDHQDVATDLNNLGSILVAMGNYASARRHLERALALREEGLGQDHPDTAMSLNNLGEVLRRQGDLPGARPLLERALATSEKIFGPDHRDTAFSLNNLGMLLDSQGNPSAARPYFDRALSISEKALGPNHPDTRTVAQNIAILLDEAGLTVEATALRKKFGLEKPN